MCKQKQFNLEHIKSVSHLIKNLFSQKFNSQNSPYNRCEILMPIYVMHFVKLQSIVNK